MDASAEPLPAEALSPDDLPPDPLPTEPVLADSASAELAEQPSGPARPLSALAVTSFAAGLAGLFPLGLLAGVGALCRMRRRGHRGTVLAVGGLAMSAAWVLAVSLAVAAVGGPAGLSRLVALDSRPTPAASPAPAAGKSAARGRVAVLTLATGACFDSPLAVPVTVTEVSCASRHSAQVYARFRLTGPDLHYPGQARVESLARQGCRARTRALGTQDSVPDDATVRVLFPLAGPWLTGQRSVSCVIVSPRQSLNASLVNS